jgi:hypothetical protein
VDRNGSGASEIATSPRVRGEKELCRALTGEQENLPMDQSMLDVALAARKAAPKRKTKSSAADYAVRLAREQAQQRRRYCNAFALWRSCRRKSCRRRQSCGGDAKTCLKRALGRVPHQTQWRVRADILAATPRNIGAPERQARQCMPRDLFG